LVGTIYSTLGVFYVDQDQFIVKVSLYVVFFMWFFTTYSDFVRGRIDGGLFLCTGFFIYLGNCSRISLKAYIP